MSLCYLLLQNSNDNYLLIRRGSFCRSLLLESSPVLLPSEAPVHLQSLITDPRKYDSPSHTLRAFIPRHAQPAYLAIRAFNLEIARIADTVSTSQVGALRLQFWRDNINAAFAGRPPKQPVAILLSHVLDGLSGAALSSKPPLSKAWFLRVIDAREKYLDNAPYPDLAALESYAEHTYSTLLYLTLQALPLHSISLDHLASHIGKASGIVAVLRGLPLLAFPPPPNHHSNSKGLSPGVEAQRSGSQQGSVTLPLDIMADAGVREEDVLRKGAEAAGLRDAVFKVATRASDHLITARSMLRQLQKGEEVDHAFEGDVEEEREDYTGEGYGKVQSEVEQGFGVLIPAVSTSLWLRRLEKVDFDIFQEELRRREWKLPWKAYWAHTRKKL